MGQMWIRRRRNVRQKRSEARDRSRGEQAPRTQHAPRLGQRSDAVAAFDEVVERPEQEDDVVRPVGLGQHARVAFLRDETPGRTLPRLPYVQRRDVNELYVVTRIGEPLGVYTRTTPDVQDADRRGREVPQQQLLRSRELEPPVASLEPAELFAGLVVTRGSLRP